MATIRDVAKRAAVAASTVSHVLNGSASISEETRRRVLQAAEELGYVHRRRRSSARKRIVIFTDYSVNKNGNKIDRFEDNIGGTIVRSAYEYLAENDCEVWIAPYTGHHVTARVDPTFLHNFSGALIVGQMARAFPPIEEMPLPSVLANCTDRTQLHLSVLADDLRGAYTATKHLISLGHRSIAFVSGPSDWLVSRDRLQGFLIAMQEVNLEVTQDLIAYGDWRIDGGRRAIAEICSRRKFSAVFAANDLMAYGVVCFLQEQGLRVPQDVAVVGYDNRSISERMSPQLTTIELPFAEIGRRAAQELLSVLKRGGNYVPDPSRILIPCPLIIRDSCGAKLVEREGVTVKVT